MSHDVAIHLGGSQFPNSEYETFLSCCLKLQPDLQLKQEHPLDLAASLHLHSAWLGSKQTSPEAMLDEDWVGIHVDLYKQTDAIIDAAIGQKTWWISVETSAARSRLSLVLQLFVPLVAFASFSDCILEDTQSTLPDGLNHRIYPTAEAYLEHTKHILDHWSPEPSFQEWLHKCDRLTPDNHLVIPDWLKEALRSKVRI